MASITKRGKTWSVRLSVSTENGRELVNQGGFRTKKEALMWARKNEVQKDNGVNLAAGKQPFIDYFINWYHTYKEPHLAKSSRLRYQYTIGIVSNYFAGKSLNGITRIEYQKFLNDYAHPEGEREKSINSSEKVNTQIKAAVHDALEEGLIQRDFTAHTTIMGRPEKAKEMKYLDAGDTAKLMRALESDINIAHITKFMALVALQTGARFSEVAGMTWDDFSYNFKTIRINKAWDTLSKNGFKATKNEQSKRLLKITDHLADLLKNYQTVQQIKLTELGVKNPFNLIFLNVKGGVPDSTGANKTLHAVLKRLGCKDITFHGLRHTHASYLIFKGVSIYYISSRLGHANYSTTIRVYSHMLKEMETIETKKAVAALATMDTNKKPNNVHKLYTSI